MASILELLEALNTKGASVSTADLADDLKASKEGTLKQLTRQKEKGNVSGNSQEGWLITEAGREELEKGEIHPSMLEEGVTPRQQFEAIGQLIGIKEDRIVLATDIVWSGDFNDVKWVWEALGQADIAKDLRSVWVNAWRARLHKGIPLELETELAGVSKAVGEAEKDAVPSKRGRDFIILDDEPVRVGENLGDYSLQDAKDILSIRALRGRFGGAGQSGAPYQPPAASEKVSELLSALGPYINKGSDLTMMKEIIADKVGLMGQDILSRIPQPGQPPQPRSFIEQITEVVGAISSLRELGPTLRSILGVPEPSSNPPQGTAVQLTGPDGKPLVMDLGQVIDWTKFQSGERRADERHGALMGMAQAVRENLGDGIAAIKTAAEQAKGSAGSKAKASSPQQTQVFKCGDCGTVFSPPAEWGEQPIKCPNPACGREYTKEELLA